MTSLKANKIKDSFFYALFYLGNKDVRQNHELEEPTHSFIQGCPKPETILLIKTESCHHLKKILNLCVLTTFYDKWF